MSQPLFTLEERERRLRIIERGVTEEFWKVLKDSMAAYCAVRSRESLELTQEGHEKEALRVALEVKAVERIMAEPAIIIQHNKPLFEGSLKEKIKQALSKKKEASNV
jgi:hypothetical protein